MRHIYGDEQHEKARLQKKEMEQAVLIPTINFFDDPEQFGLEDRQGQAMMSIDIAEAISKHHHIMVEAGAGIGKTLAYLIPALFAVQRFNKSVVIAADSIALAEQLVRDAEQAKLLTGILTPDVIWEKGPILSRGSNARIIIINQELFIRQLLKESSLGQNFKKDHTILYIIDEAHHLEKNARSAFGAKWTMQGLKSMERALQRGIPKSPARQEHIENLRTVGEYREQFFSGAAQKIQKLQSALLKQQDAQKVWLPNKPIVNYGEWAKGVEKVIKACSASLSEEALELPQFIRRLWQYANSSHLVWLEGDFADPYDFSICTAPKNISNELEKLLFSKSIPVVLTSETLCNTQGTKQDMYRYYAEAVGFPEDNSDLGDVEPSTFNNEENSLLYIPNDLPRPDDQNQWEVYLTAIADRITELILLSKGRTVVLFTAQDDMREVHALLTSKKLPYELLLAEGDISPQMIDQFANNQGVLLATGDYWEKIHITGAALSSLIIVQLPFPAFDPIIDYKISQVLDPLEILLPEMLTKLRQGVGRLIQTSTDTGVVSILDTRISDSYTLPYKETVLKALPMQNKVSSLLEVEVFIGKKIKE